MKNLVEDAKNNPGLFFFQASVFIVLVYILGGVLWSFADEDPELQLKAQIQEDIQTCVENKANCIDSFADNYDAEEDAFVFTRYQGETLSEDNKIVCKIEDDNVQCELNRKLKLGSFWWAGISGPFYLR